MVARGGVQGWESYGHQSIIESAGDVGVGWFL